MNGFIQNNAKGNHYQFNSGVMKYRPVVNPSNNSLRPCLWRCCSCMPISRAYIVTPLLENSNLLDILKMPYDSNQPSKLNYFKRNLCILHYVATRKVVHHYPVITESDLHTNRLLDAIQKTISEGTQNSKLSTNEIEKSVQTQIKSLVRKMRASISNKLIRITGWFLHKLLSRLLSSIVVHSGQTQILQRIALEKKPIVFLPTHRSHLDYILITFTLFNLSLHAPHVAAGENLLIPFFGLLMRGLGGFFIRRKLDLEVGKKDLIYRALLQSYVEEVMKHGEYLEIFIEGGRTRSGKALYPKSGLLSVIVEAYNEGIIEDAYVVPVSLSYDKLLDGNFTSELMGLPKKYETFFGTVKAIYKVVTSHYGSARVNFFQPFSLKELIFSFSSSSVSNNTLLSIENQRKVSDISLSNSGSDIRPLVDHLALHVIYSSVQMQTIMSTQVLALIIMNKYRQDVTMSKLIQEFDHLVVLIKLRDHDVGFCGNTMDVINDALELLTGKLVCNKYDDDNNEKSIVKMSENVTNILELSYYSNAALVVFAAESVIVNSFFSIVKTKCDAMHKYEVPFNQILSNSVELCQLLKYEFIFAPPCETLEFMMTLALERLQKAELIFPLENLESDEEKFLKMQSLRIVNSIYNNDLTSYSLPHYNVSDNQIIYTKKKKVPTATLR